MLENRLTRMLPLYDQAYTILSNKILNGDFAPDEKLTDGGLAEMLGISRTPVREAVRQLVREGLLVGTPNRSVTIFNPSMKDIAEIYSIRSSLEGLAAKLACLNSQKNKYIEKLERCLEEAKSKDESSLISASARANTRFHDLVIEASGNDSLIHLYESIKNKVMICRLTSMRNKVKMNIALDEHTDLIEILRNGNEAECEEAFKDHVIQSGLRMMRHGLEELESNDPIFIMYQKRIK